MTHQFESGPLLAFACVSFEWKVVENLQVPNLQSLIFSKCRRLELQGQGARLQGAGIFGGRSFCGPCATSDV
ncbi:hypothetical protein WG66_006271 [Moniliophthora roreri]|nr:hypothetical protein WG66_006271 [Moniliophthora roreri]